MIAIEEQAAPTPDEFMKLAARGRPFVVRGLVADWPLVQAGRSSADQAIAQLTALDSGAPAEVMIAPPSEGGRFFYRDDFSGFNFTREKATLQQIGAHLLELAGAA